MSEKIESEYEIRKDSWMKNAFKFENKRYLNLGCGCGSIEHIWQLKGNECIVMCGKWIRDTVHVYYRYLNKIKWRKCIYLLYWYKVNMPLVNISEMDEDIDGGWSVCKFICIQLLFCGRYRWIAKRYRICVCSKWNKVQ